MSKNCKVSVLGTSRLREKIDIPSVSVKVLCNLGICAIERLRCTFSESGNFVSVFGGLPTLRNSFPLIVGMCAARPQTYGVPPPPPLPPRPFKASTCQGTLNSLPLAISQLEHSHPVSLLRLQITLIQS